MGAVPTPAGSPIADGNSVYQQPTALHVMDDVLVAARDRGRFTSGVWVIDADTGHTEARWPLLSGELSYLQYGDGSSVGRRGKELYLTFPDTGGSANLKTYVAGTGDAGRTWHLLSTIDSAPGGAARDGVVGPDENGYMCTKVLGHSPFLNNMVRAEVPAWTWTN